MNSIRRSEVSLSGRPYIEEIALLNKRLAAPRCAGNGAVTGRIQTRASRAAVKAFRPRLLPMLLLTRGSDTSQFKNGALGDRALPLVTS